ncbi:MAG: hypothetical protein OXC63_02525 [Aestuariivita sp.]|nr:hypothetical protein [Aestuariivita sp.]MCY4347242.1 hypothetical protein [Aestuariivita sp.]
MTCAISERLEFAKSIAFDAGTLAIQMRNERGYGFASQKSHQDFVTAADLAVEDLIRGRILDRFPGDSILGEEQGSTGDSNSIWIVDPIDGTTNYMHGMPEWAVSIGYCNDHSIQCGTIYAPDISTLVSARAGQGSHVAANSVEVSKCERIDNALVLLGRSARHGTKDHLDNIGGLIASGVEYRRNGSAAYSLLAIATGRAEAFYEAHLNPWDAVAGILLVIEAAGQVDYPPLVDFLTQGGPVLASNTILHDDVRSAIFCASGG